VPNAELQGLSWAKIFTEQDREQSVAYQFPYRMISENVPVAASIGLVVDHGDFRDYPLFGQDFTRRVTEVSQDKNILPLGNIEPFARDFQHSDFIVVEKKRSQTITDFPSDGYLLLSEYGIDSLWIRSDLRSSGECDQDKWPFKNFYKTTTDIVCPQFPISIGGRARIPNGSFMPTFGAGALKKLRFGLLVRKLTSVKFSITVEPKKVDSQRTLQLTITGSDSQSQIISMDFDNQNNISDFSALLKPDNYKISFTLGNNSRPVKVLEVQVTTP
jgi:hypothetical protein